MGDYSTGLFSCFSDFGLCLSSFVIPCYQAGANIGHAANEGVNCLWCLLSFCFPFCATFVSRTRVQERHSIDENIISKLLISFLCFPCSLAQDARELRKDGSSQDT